jgi:hypothetical protein
MAARNIPDDIITGHRMATLSQLGEQVTHAKYLYA